jgi:hypothetical protein
MSLKERCVDAFEEVQRNAGFQDFMEDRIEVVHRGAAVVESWVFGGIDTVHRVRVAWPHIDRQKLEVSCDCASFAESFACSHVWATLLTLDQELGPDLVAGSGPLDLKPVLPKISLSKPVEGEHLDWRRQLELVADLQRAALRQQEGVETGARGDSETCLAWYRLDLPASEATGRLAVEVLIAEEDGQLRSMAKGGEDDRLMDEEDRWLVEVLSAFPTGDGHLRVWVPPPLVDFVLPRLCATGRFGWQPRRTTAAGTLQPMRWRSGEPWRFSLHWVSAEGPFLEVRGRLLRGQEVRSLRDPLLLLTSAGLVAFPRDLGRLSLEGAGPWITVLRQVGVIRIPRGEVEEFRRRAAALPYPPAFLTAQPLENGLGQG